MTESQVFVGLAPPFHDTYNPDFPKPAVVEE